VELLIDRVLVDNGEVEIRYVIPTAPHGETTHFYQLRKDYFQMPFVARLRTTATQAIGILLPKLPTLNLSQFVARKIWRRRGVSPLRCRAHRL